MGLVRSLRLAAAAVALLVGALFGMACAGGATQGFVTRSGSTLRLNGGNFRFAGANMYWLGLTESPSVHLPSHFEVDDALATANEMGLTVVRSHTLGDTVGCSQCLEPALGQFNPSAFQAIDYAVKAAHDHGLRLVIPLVDHGAYYEGGIGTYTRWRGLSDGLQFYTDPTVISDFEQHIDALLRHVNSYTGIALKDDPTILAWEEGNELAAPPAWINAIASHIRGVDSNHLVAYGALKVLQSNSLSTSVDIEDVHYYPLSVSQADADAAAVQSAGKVYYAGEYDWTGIKGGDPLPGFLSALKNNGAAGDSFWSLFPHAPTFGYVRHGDGYTLHYPGDDANMRSAAQTIRSHGYALQGLPAPGDRVPPAPLITSVSGQKVGWRGSVAAASYSVESSTAGPTGPWTRICNGCATDNDTPWTDTGQPTSGTVWYHVKAYNRTGMSSPWSPAFQYR